MRGSNTLRKNQFIILSCNSQFGISLLKIIVYLFGNPFFTLKSSVDNVSIFSVVYRKRTSF